MHGKKFVQELATFSGENVFNPYSQRCETFDRYNGHIIRMRNLSKAIDSFTNDQVDAIWIGRDLGYRGGRRTGLALTDEAHLEDASTLWRIRLDIATKGALSKERTASNIWSILNRIDASIFMWNVFPFHPHEHNSELSNRRHTAAERDAGLEILRELVGILQPGKLVAIGNDAFSGAVRIFDSRKVYKVRHPSYGGESQFIRQMVDLYPLQRR